MSLASSELWQITSYLERKRKAQGWKCMDCPPHWLLGPPPEGGEHGRFSCCK